VERLADEALIRRIKAGDADAFEEIVKTYEKPIYNLALRYTANPDDAFDVTQDVFLRVYRSIDTFKGQSKFSTWLYQIATNICIDYCRKASRKKEISMVVTDESGEETEMDFADTSPTPEQSVEHTELREEITRCIEKLGDEHRMILILRDIDGLSYQEIGSILGMEQGTVKSRLFRAREKLRGLLLKSGNFSHFPSSNKTKGGESHGR